MHQIYSLEKNGISLTHRLQDINNCVFHNVWGYIITKHTHAQDIIFFSPLYIFVYPLYMRKYMTPSEVFIQIHLMPE